MFKALLPMAPIMELSSDRNRRGDTAVLEKYRKALMEFQKPNEHPNEDVEAYFEYVTKVGRSCLPWDIIKPAFLWKIKFVMDEMIRIDHEREGCSAEQPIGSELKQAYDFILDKASEFDGAPFTWQRHGL
uniref:ACB domain-containing protein n=1 Tax=Heterorhabditis bacteriophora TaxID=37862 RepID=A0A1I7XVY7_HETBA